MKLFLTILFIASFPFVKKDYSYPESVVRHGNYLYMTGDGKRPSPVEKNGDGVIMKLSLSGEVIDGNISKVVLHSPKGAVIIHDVIYVADIDRVVGISLETGRMVREIDFSGRTKLLNDIAVKDDHTLFVSATDINKVFKVELNKAVSIEALPVPDIAGANGLVFDKRSDVLYVAGFGSLTDTLPTGIVGRISFNGGSDCTFTKIFDQHGYYDGIQLVDGTTLLVSDWRSLKQPDGRIIKIHLSNGQGTLVQEHSVKGSPADFYYDHELGVLYIPMALQSGFSILKGM